MRVINEADGIQQPDFVNGLFVVELNEHDIWGNPFLAVVRKGISPVECYVYSSGPDGESTSRGRDTDDISSDMKTIHTNRYAAQQQVQLLMALAIPQIVWL